MIVTPVQGLLERERDVRQIAAFLGAADDRGERVLAIEGPAGIGKTALLHAARWEAERAGSRCLWAQGGELEGELPWEVARRLLGPAVLGVSAKERGDILAGAAAAGGAVVDPGGGHPPAGADTLAATLNGLYWICVNLAERGPLLLAVDDAHWADPESLKWLSFLAQRIEGLPISIALTARSGGASHPLAAFLAACPVARIQPAPLSESGTARLVAMALPDGVHEAFARACHSVTAGNPFLLHELLLGLVRDGIAPTEAAAERIRGFASEAIARAVFLRLARLPEEARPLARAVAVLGTGAQPRHAQALAELDDAAAVAALDALVSAEVLAAGTPLDFVHPLVRSAVYSEMPRAELALAHRRAARLLADADPDPAHAASHLLASDPSGERWELDALRAAARSAVARAAPEVAVRYLRRALSAAPASGERAELLFELGSAEALARDPEAADHLRDALSATAGAGERAVVASTLGRLLFRSGRADEAIRLLGDELERLSPDERDRLSPNERELALRLKADLGSAAWVVVPPRPDLAQVAAQDGDLAGATRGERQLLAVRAFGAVVAGEPAAEAAELALRALDGGLLADETADAPIVYFAASALTWTDRLDVADRVYRDAIEEARRRRSVIGYAVACCWRAKNTLFMGDLAGAEEDARNALAVAGEFGWDVLVPMARGYLAEVLLERGDLRGARTTLADACDAAIPESLVLQPLLHARGWLKVLEGDGGAGLEDLLACGDRQARWGAAGPAPVPWRSSAAVVLDAQGEHAQARELAREEVAAARRFGAPRPLSLALRAAAAVERGRGGLELLQEALATLEGSQAKLARARALVDLGAALRRAGRKGDARDVLREGLDLAGSCGCLPLAERARAELVAAGARPRRDALYGRSALTHSELRVAELAAAGRTNKEIAQDLFVTLRTVETHLTRTYRKLEVEWRSGLAEALAARQPS